MTLRSVIIDDVNPGDPSRLALVALTPTTLRVMASHNGGMAGVWVDVDRTELATAILALYDVTPADLDAFRAGLREALADG